jgi:hypothetical protein
MLGRASNRARPAGAVVREEVQLPSGAFQRRDVVRNAMGCMLEASEWS